VDAEVHPWDARSPLSVAATILTILTFIKVRGVAARGGATGPSGAHMQCLLAQTVTTAHRQSICLLTSYSLLADFNAWSPRCVRLPEQRVCDVQFVVLHTRHAHKTW
jgi:hypothetical protein